MNTTLLLTTVVAVAVAIAALIAFFVVFRDERRRSFARAQALRQMALGAEPEPVAAPVEIDLDLTSYPSDEYLAVPASSEPSQPMFGGADAQSPWGRRIAAAAIMAIIVGAAGYVLIPRSGSRAAGASAAPAQAPPLELLSLRHAQEEGRLVITGLVQNPRNGVQLTRVVATAFLFGPDGTFLASGRAPLDFSTLAAGEESPFVLTVPVSTTVARYRVGFRREDGRVIGHVDRRAAGTLARTGE
jgi:hypothetical protein